MANALKVRLKTLAKMRWDRIQSQNNIKSRNYSTVINFFEVLAQLNQRNSLSLSKIGAPWEAAENTHYTPWEIYFDIDFLEADRSRGKTEAGCEGFFCNLYPFNSHYCNAPFRWLVECYVQKLTPSVIRGVPQKRNLSSRLIINFEPVVQIVIRFL